MRISTDQLTRRRCAMTVVVGGLVFCGLPSIASAAGTTTTTVTTPTGTTTTTTASVKASNSLLAVQSARSAVLTPVAKRPRTYDLLLRGVAPRVSAFDSAPGAGTRTMTNPALLGALFPAAGAQPHNASVTVGTRSMAFVLRSGRYDRKHRTMRYRLTLLAGAKALPKRLDRPTLFIDSIFGGMTCTGQMYNNSDETLYATDWGDPDTYDQSMTSRPGDTPGNGGYTNWASQAATIYNACSNWATFTQGSQTLTISMDAGTSTISCTAMVPSGSFDAPLTCTYDEAANAWYVTGDSGFR